MFWFRIELDEKGQLISSKQVDSDNHQRGDGRSVFYFSRPTKEIAEVAAYREYHRLRQTARRAIYKAQGKCKCGRARDKETPEQRAFATCPGCRALHGPQHLRASARAKGLPVPPPVGKAVQFADRRNEEKLELLQEVQEQFLRSTMGVFGKWLQAEIEKLQPKPATKLRVVGNR